MIKINSLNCKRKNKTNINKRLMQRCLEISPFVFKKMPVLQRKRKRGFGGLTQKMLQRTLVCIIRYFLTAFSTLTPCSVDLPSIPLETGGPALQHLGKTRPKPARMQRGRQSTRPPTYPVNPASADSTPPAPESTPPSDSTPHQVKVAMKPPSPQVAQKMIQQLLEVSDITIIPCM